MEPLLASQRLRGVCIVSTGEADWPAAQAAAAHPATATARAPERVSLALGVHPWWLHEQLPGWQRRLGDALEKWPAALVGECGLDRARRGLAPLDVQLAALRDQLQLAAEYGRPAVVHCVRAHGHLLALLTELAPLPPALILHAYGGSPETAAALLRLGDTVGGTRVYFGVSPAAACLKRAAATIGSVPADRLLIESDTYTAGETLESAAGACQAVAAVRGWTLERAARITAQNAVVALQVEVGPGGSREARALGSSSSW